MSNNFSNNQNFKIPLCQFYSPVHLLAKKYRLHAQRSVSGSGTQWKRHRFSRLASAKTDLSTYDFFSTSSLTRASFRAGKLTGVGAHLESG